MSKLPAIQIYPGDWLRDPVSGCSIAAQGLWMRMMFVMHDSDSYGRLTINGQPMPAEMVARKCGLSPIEYQSLLSELLEAGIPSIERGILFCRRMVRDAKQRRLWAKRQKKHRHKDGQHKDSSHGPVTPKSQVSSSSSSSSIPNTKTTAVAPPFPQRLNFKPKATEKIPLHAAINDAPLSEVTVRKVQERYAQRERLAPVAQRKAL